MTMAAQTISTRLPNLLIAAVIVAVSVVANTADARAHPHVWVSVQTTVAYENGTVKGITHRWTFDDMYTAMAIQGLDKNQDGVYDREELKELAQVNIDGLKEFDYFTYARIGQDDLALSKPIDYWLEHKDGILALYFTLPLAKPVLAEAQGFNFQVYDPSYFIAFDLAEKDPAVLGRGAPDGCAVDISVPEADMQQAQDLSDSFLSQFGGNFGLTLAKTIAVKCAQT
ncbi:MAG: DUF1007 family protein [Pseudomonadota bacterium]